MKILKLFAYILLIPVFLALLLFAYINWGNPPGFEQKVQQITIDPTPERLRIGKKIALNFCKSCHLSDQGTLSGKVLMNDQKWGIISTANLTNIPNSIVAAYSDGELISFLKTGVKKDGKMALPMMPKLALMSDEDLASIIAFLRSDDPLLAATESNIPPSQPGLLVKALMKFEIKPVENKGVKINTPPGDDLLLFGEYLVTGRYACFECHSRSPEKINYLQPSESEGYLGGGSNLMTYGNSIGIKSANITPHPTMGIGKWTFEKFVNVVTTGIRPDGKPLRPPMNQMKLDSIELIAIWSYLQSVPPISNQWDYKNRIEVPAN
jgi:hypothetical protein